MPESREQIIHMLTEAAEIEHNLLCSYLYAAFSLRERTAFRFDQEEGDAVDRWRRKIMSVAIEEMGHLALVNNLIVAIGGAPHFDRPNFPVSPGYHPASFVIRLTPFDWATLEHFIYLERPQDVPLRDHATFEPESKKERLAPETRITPSAFDYETIGEFYSAIRDQLTSLASDKGRETFVGAGRGQFGKDIADLPGLMIIHDLATALQALDTIVEQGEGSSTACEDCHFTRFMAIKSEWAALEKKNPDFAPAYPTAENPVMRRPLEHGDQTWITAPQSAALLDLGNALYAETLIMLAQIYDPLRHNGEAKAFAGAAIELMHAVGQIGSALARIPARPDASEGHAGMTFAVPRNIGIRGRHSRIATTVERLQELMAASAGIDAHEASQRVASAWRSLKAFHNVTA